MLNMVKVQVVLNGLTPIMFDKWVSQDETPVEQKIYLDPRDGKTVCLPSSSIEGFLASKDSHSCLRMFVNSKEWKTLSPVIRGCISVQPAYIPFQNGKEHEESNVKLEVAEDLNKSPFYIDTRMARPNPKVRVNVSRPVLDLPWSLKFNISIYENEYFSISKAEDWFNRGGIFVGLCAYRPTFGSFEVVEWKKVKEIGTVQTLEKDTNPVTME